MPEIPPLYQDLSFNTPLSDARAADLIGMLDVGDQGLVADFGCGWGELLCRVAAAYPAAIAQGVDRGEANIARARAVAVERGLANVAFRVGDAAQVTGPVDAAICIGASQVWGGFAAALTALAGIVRPGGRLLLGEAIWSRPPEPAATAALGGDPAEMPYLGEVVDMAVDVGFRVWHAGEASTDEWDEFESGYARGWERWLQANPDDVEATDVRDRADTHRRRYLHGYRGTLGMAYLVLRRG